MFLIYFIIFLINAKQYSSQDDEGPYLGKFIGKINSYHHQVSGDVYAVDEWSLLLVDFNYDGAGDDTFFWAGESTRPGPQGFIVPDQHGKTNVLERYYNEEVRLTLPEGKRVSSIRWLAVYDISLQSTFGDVYVEEEFQPPAPVELLPLEGGARSGPLRLLTDNTILIPEFHYEGGEGEVYFWTGVGPQPSIKGTKIPDDYGYLEPLRPYAGKDVLLTLPGALSVRALHWLAVYDVSARRALAHVPLPELADVPPAAARAAAPAAAPTSPRPPHCRQLHRRLQVRWEVFGDQLTVQLAGAVGEREYMALGVSGRAGASVMAGADVGVAWYDARARRGRVADYNVSAPTPCGRVLGEWRGVCRDAAVGGADNLQLLAAERVDGITTVSYRRPLKPAESMDLEFNAEGVTWVVWAVGEVDAEGEPTFHTLYPRAPVSLRLAGGEGEGQGDACWELTAAEGQGQGGGDGSAGAWDTAELSEPSLRVFTATLGPGAGRRAHASHQAPTPALVWYVNGHMTPALQIRRGLQYEFKVYGGDDPHSATHYHPLVVRPPSPQAAPLAGLSHSRRGRPAPSAAGPLCLAEHAPAADRRRDDDFPTFRAYNRSLLWRCSPGAPATLRLAPNSSWPDLLVYDSYTQPGMGGPIYVVDRHRRGLSRRNAAAAAASTATVAAALSLALLAF